MSDSQIFSAETLGFLRDVENNNTRDWFNAHKDSYLAAWKAPAEALIEAMCFRLQVETDTPHDAKLFRIHRDVRFSKDKTPYSPHIHILFRREGSKTGLFFGLHTDRLVLGAGMMGFDKGQLAAYRDAVSSPSGKLLQAELDLLLGQGSRMNSPDLARVPKPHDKDHKRGDLLRRKSLTIWRDYEDPTVVEQSDLIQLCAAQFATYDGVRDWLNTHIPTAAQRR